MTRGGASERVLEQAHSSTAFTAVTAEVGDADGCVWQFARGTLALGDPTAVTPETVFDLASLTKVLATTTLALWLEAHGHLDLSWPVATVTPAWSAADRARVSVRDLFEHASGLPAYRPYYLTLAGRVAYEQAIAAEALEYETRTRALYSDLGFILLGFALADVRGQPLDRQFVEWMADAGISAEIAFSSHPSWQGRIAATEHDPWRGRLIRGEVHDENACALGGTAGHAGLFGTAAAVGAIARWWLSRLRGADDPSSGVAAARARRFAERSTVPGSSRAIGWDTMRPTSSCGTRWSPAAIGHTGFTGTSLWLDPPRNRYAVLLTNRVHPTRAGDRITSIRRDFHDAVVADFG
jgi:CubicO group peptidase (beta-lactamase class C family)